eukprot:gene19616-39036_t
MHHQLRTAVESGVALGAWIFLREALLSEAASKAGYDYVCVDLQHGLVGFEDLSTHLQAIALGSAAPVVRVPWNEPGIVGKVLDGGAWGVICPMVNTAAEAKALVSYALYPPKGKRSNGPIRAGAYGEATPYQAMANDEVLIIPMIETQE